MKREEIRKQCLEWKARTEKHFNWIDPRAKKMKKEMNNFTTAHLSDLSSPKYEVFDIAKTTNHDQERYPIFFIRERQIMGEGDSLEWRYFGSLFAIEEGKVKYQTTTSFIPEEDIKPFN